MSYHDPEHFVISGIRQLDRQSRLAALDRLVAYDQPWVSI